ncbi:MAG: M14 family zinc carboxypeptidase [Rhodocyclaceae bacterium]
MSASDLPELAQLERVVAEGGSLLDVRTACTVSTGGREFPVHAICLGNPDPGLPAVAFIGGVHGLERIGAEVVLAYLGSLVVRLRWDATLLRALETVRLVFVPLVNPGGLWRGTRANPNGVDLMRNAPVEAAEPVPFLVGGQRLSPGAPWYRGPAGAGMEAESRALCEIVSEELLPRPFSLSIDCHSGFGFHDRIWFPYAYTAAPIAHLAEIHALTDIYDRTYAHHRYLFEPQSRQYLTHGDLWDHLYRQALADPARVFLPMTLEMGSWLWVKKNPRQIFSRHGMFNPLIGHRQQRVLRRHVGWLEFLNRAACSYRNWLPVGEDRKRHEVLARERWYRNAPR